jgi:glycosyltransferase involved in cell wall biosynthesis
MLFSIITVVKNRVDKIESTMRSVKEQSFKDYEHIIVDGNSTDGTHKKIIQNKNNKISAYKRADKNLYDALNFAITKAKGEYVILLHCGDLFFNNEVLFNYSKFAEKNFKLFFGGVLYINNKNFFIRSWLPIEDKIFLKHSYKIPHISLVAKTKLLLKNKYNIKYNISSDTDLIIKLLNKTRAVNTFFITHIMESGGISSQYINLYKKIFQDLLIYLKNYKFYFLTKYLAKIFYKFYQIIDTKNLFFNKLIVESFKYTQTNIFNNNFNKKAKEQLKIVDVNYFLNKRIDKIIYISINLTFLYFNNLFSKFTNVNYFKYWIDGHAYRILRAKKKFHKTPGRHILKDLLNNVDNYKFDKINFIGDIKLNEKNYFFKFFSNKKNNTKLSFFNPGYGEIFEVAKKMKPSKGNELTIICLPTPMQELCAMFIAIKSKKFKIICVGGALHMVTGNERPISDKYDFPLLETLYRLRNDSRRRIMRFLRAIFYLIVNINDIQKKYQLK